MDDNKYYVNRVHSWPDGDYFVEVVLSLDAGDPGTLVPVYRRLGEGDGFLNPKEAAVSAVRVQRQWIKDKQLDIELAYNGAFAGQLGVPGERVTACELFAWARKEFEQLERCAECGEIMGGERYMIFDDIDDTFCSQVCAENAYDKWLEDSATMFWEEDDYAD